MAQNYVVNYDINVISEDAVQAISRFTIAAKELQRAYAPFQKINEKIGRLKNNIQSLSSMKATVNIDVSAAEANLDRLLGKIDAVKAAARSLNMPIGGGATGAIASAGKTSISTLASSASSKKAPGKTSTSTIVPTATQNEIKALDATKRAKAIKNNAKYYGRNYKTDKAYQNAAKQAAEANKAVFGERYPEIAERWGKEGPSRGGMVATRGRRVAPARSIFPNALGYKMFGATPLDIGGVGAVSMLKGMGVAYGIMGIGTAIGNAIGESTDYDNIMQTAKNILISHDDKPNFQGRFKNMEHNVRQVGVKTKFTAAEVADAARFLAMAGLNIDEINSSIRPVADIALIADEDIGRTADVVTNIMTAYGMKANQMRSVADKMTMTFTMSNTTLSEMAESYKYFASIARANNWSFDETTGMIGILGDAGLKGSHAGTTIRQLMNNLIKPTKGQKATLDKFGVKTKDKNGALRSPFAIFKDLRDAGAQASAFNLFRVTAAQGGVSLMQSIDKWDKVIEQNRQSSGISSRLAEAKQNTVQGLWAQVTSMFTEGAMQAFEAVRPEVSGMLANLTNWLATDDARNRIKGFANDILSFARIMGNFTKTMLDVYESFKGLIMWLMKVQLYFWPLIYTIRVFRSGWYLVLGALKGVDVFFKINGALALLTSNIKKSTAALIGFGRAQAGVQSSGSIGFLNGFAYKNAVQQHSGTVTPEVWSRYVQMQKSRPGGYSKLLLSGIGGALPTAISSIGGGFAGYAIGNSINENVGGLLGAVAGTAIGGALGSMGLVGALFTNPVGWGILAAGALAGVTAYIVNVNKSIKEGVRLSQEWGKEFRNLGVNGLDLNDPDSLVIGGLRILNNELISQTERLTQAIDLWQRYYKAKNGDNIETIKKDTTPLVDIPGGKEYASWLERADQWGGVKTPFMELVSQMRSAGLPIVTDGKYISIQSSDGTPEGRWRQNILAQQTGPLGNYMPEEAAVQIAAAQWAANPNNARYKTAETYLMNALTTVSRSQDIPNILAKARKDYYIKPNMDYKWITSEDAQKLSEYDTMTIPAAAAVFNYMIDQLIKTRFAKWTEVLTQYDATGNVKDEDIQLAVQSRIGELHGLLFNVAYGGLVGSKGWITYWQNLINNPTLLKNEKGESMFTSADEVKSYISTAHNAFMEMYGQLADRYKGLFSGLIGDDLWSPLLDFTPSPTPMPTGKGALKPVDEGTPGVNNNWNPSSKSKKVGGVKTSKGTTTIPNPLPKVTTTNVGGDQANYKSHYKNSTAAPKQVIVKIENLMNVKSIDLANSDNVAVIDNVKAQLTQALIDVVHDFDETYHG